MPFDINKSKKNKIYDRISPFEIKVLCKKLEPDLLMGNHQILGFTFFLDHCKLTIFKILKHFFHQQLNDHIKKFYIEPMFGQE